MDRFRSERGATLIMLMGVIAVLAVLAATLVMVTVNVKGSTKDVITRSQAFNVAEAGLDLGMFSLSSAWPSPPPVAGAAVTLSADPRTMFDATQFPTSAGKQFITVTMLPGSDIDHLLLQSQANVGGKSIRLQTQIERKSVGISTLSPGVALYSGGNTTISGNPFVGSPMVNGVPTGSVYVYGSATLSGNPDVSTVGVKVRGSLNVSGNPSFSSIKTQNDLTVPTFDQFLPQSQIDFLTQQVQALQPDPTGVTRVAGGGTIPTWAPAVHVTGNATISSNGTYTIGSLYVDGSFTISGNATLNIGALYVGGSFTGSGNIVLANLGPTWVGGNITLSGNGDCKLPMLVAGGNITLSGNATWGGNGVAPNMKPCIAISVGTNKNVTWSGNSDFYGLLAATQGSVVMSGNGKVHGSILSHNAATFSGNPNIVYDGNVVNSIQVGSATIAKLVPGTWSQIATQ